MQISCPQGIIERHINEISSQLFTGQYTPPQSTSVKLSSLLQSFIALDSWTLPAGTRLSQEEQEFITRVEKATQPTSLSSSPSSADIEQFELSKKQVNLAKYIIYKSKTDPTLKVPLNDEVIGFVNSAGIRSMLGGKRRRRTYRKRRTSRVRR
jgi:hypothetical protein